MSTEEYGRSRPVKTLYTGFSLHMHKLLKNVTPDKEDCTREFTNGLAHMDDHQLSWAAAELECYLGTQQGVWGAQPPRSWRGTYK